MRIMILIVMLLTLAACTSLPGTATLSPDSAVTSPAVDTMSTIEPKPDPLAPKPGDEQLTRAQAFINEAGLLIRESYPPQIALSLSGDLPTPCHELRVVVDAPDQENRVMVNVYSVVDPNTICTQVLAPFREQIELGTFPSGHYSVWVNGELAGEFDS